MTVDEYGSIYISCGNGVVVLNADGSEKAAYTFDIGVATDVVVAPDGSLYVSSGYFGSSFPYVTVLQPNGTVLSLFDLSAINNTVATAVAVGLGVDFTTGVIYVLNGGGVIGLYRVNGSLVSAINTGYASPSGFVRASSGTMYVATGPQLSVAVFNSAGVQTAVYDLSAYGVTPANLALDSANRLYVCDSYTTRIVVLSSTGAVVGQYNPTPDFSTTYGVVVDAAGRLYVANQAGSDIVILQPVSGQSLTINLATGYTSTSYTADSLSTTNGAQDANWKVGGQPAQVVTANGAGFNPQWLPNGPTSNWVALSATSLAASTQAQTLNFTRTFTLPASSTVDISTLHLTGQLACDKACHLCLNGALVISLDGQGWYTNYDSWRFGYYNDFTVAPSQLLLGGVNTLLLSLSTQNTTTADPEAQFTGFRLEGYVNAIVSASSVRGDPQFAGLRGQSFQVHGIDGAAYALICEHHTASNARFVFLDAGRCPIVAGAPLTNCWSHPGSYMQALSFQVRDEADGTVHTAVLTAGPASEGFASVEVDGVLLSVGSSVAVSSASFSVARISSHAVRVVTPSFELDVESSDRFVNLQQLRPRVPLDELTSHGLLGQTHSRTLHPSTLRHIEGEVDDYSLADDDLLATDFLYSRFVRQTVSEQ